MTQIKWKYGKTGYKLIRSTIILYYEIKRNEPIKNR